MNGHLISLTFPGTRTCRRMKLHIYTHAMEILELVILISLTILKDYSDVLHCLLV